SQNNPAGQIFYTTDGSDPRAIGGGISSRAISYDAPIVINGSTTVRARVKDGSTWSPIMEANYFPNRDFSNLRITEINYNPLSGAIDGDEFEFLELKNIGPAAIDLGGVYFGGISFVFTNGTQLAPGAFFVLGRNPAQFAARYPGIVLNGVYTGKLDN